MKEFFKILCAVVAGTLIGNLLYPFLKGFFMALWEVI